MKEIIFDLGEMTKKAMETFAFEFAKNVDEHNLILLIGEIGAGKTTFVKAFCKGFGVDPEIVSSPTFTLVNVYETLSKSIYHVDVYRLTNVEDLFYLLEDQIEDNDSILIVEWADLFPEFFQGDRIEIYLEHSSDHLRNVSIKVVGESERILSFLRRWRNAKKIKI
ncbi:tRNA (adenosine(37)-N6)-threonylcarbamoyltransferase complex ATPase subunit type 1 TsaE [Thermosipho ferrireducens]|uniref:tRNA threonylcarbamoyladenosine biosynthesis protein TsaE n=1 Tax=Thermosipho ferrireducens TaxID=2571116 RepID=A0ABX7S5K7_9BACT|nr:tRNA (adenosine(37)-N6)-threonylcarbamoyltransferase complex ATPase subunit type 1 TsaE [Thermosipho ferrireducens]QTA37834.1 tRNA (adenosine(37)-N6)-threonylcarbamoyltransferase complex ATPase subunit type 1 TsaE [Thermosipho ferrireducens]